MVDTIDRESYEMAVRSENVTAPRHHSAATDERDEAGLIRLGKKPVLLRNFGFMSILGFSCTILITWEGILV